LPQGNEIGTAETTTMKSGTADHTPMTLCQLKSLALPLLRANSTTGFTRCQVHWRGNQR
jgi:hypothetical protein